MARNLDRVGGVAQAAANAGVLINRKNIRFLDGGGVTWTAVDDPINDEVEVSAAAGGGGAPVGAIMDFAGTAVPSGWLECNGTAYGRTGGDPSPQVALFAAIGTTWGPGDGSTTFNVPNFARRTRVGRGGVGTGTLGNVVGNVGGAETHALITAELAAHAHGVTDPGHAHTVTVQLNRFANPPGTGTVQGNNGGPSDFITTLVTDSPAGTGIVIQNAGSGTAHNNVQPSAIVMTIIKT
jgi:microcystin-dependent protein